MKTNLFCLLMAWASISFAVGGRIGSPATSSPPTDPNLSPRQAEPIHFQNLPRPGEKCQINENFYFIYEFKLNKKNDYLLPIHIVMPGEWEVKLTFF